MGKKIPIIDGKRLCNKCSTSKPLDLFTKHKNGGFGYCLECDSRYKAEWYLKYKQKSNVRSYRKNVDTTNGLTTCTVCFIIKSINEYNPRYRNGEPYYNECKACSSRYKKIFRIDNKDRINEEDRKRRADIASFIWNLKADKPCTDCRKIFHPAAMDFDHIKGIKNGNVSHMHSIESAVKEIEKCELVCSNCHRTRTKTRATQKGLK